jgi:hypothetical protein
VSLRYLILNLTLSLTVTLGFVACGGKPDASKKDPGQTAAVGENGEVPQQQEPLPDAQTRLQQPDGFNSSLSKEKTAAEKHAERFDHREMKTGELTKDEFVLSPEGAAPKVLSGDLRIVCRSSLSEGVLQKEEITLTPGSNALLKSATNEVKRVVSIKCEGAATEDAQKVPSMNERIFEKDLSDGELAVEVVQGKMFFVSCTPGGKDLMMNNINGIQLLPGSSMMLWRDLHYQYEDGSTSARQEPVAVLHCR